MKFETWETGLCKMLHFEMPNLKRRVFKMELWSQKSIQLYTFNITLHLSIVETAFLIRLCSKNWKPQCPEATVTLVPVWKWGVSKQGILKSLVSHALNFKRLPLGEVHNMIEPLRHTKLDRFLYENLRSKRKFWCVFSKMEEWRVNKIWAQFY